ncbi:amidohydrolase family protein [Rhodococcus koreensis]
MLIAGGLLISGERADLRIINGRITELQPYLNLLPGEELIALTGGTVLPGLHDHHIHLRAAAAAAQSLFVGPALVSDEREFRSAIRRARTDDSGWIRAVGYHESVAGALDRAALDAIEPIRPIRIQHRSGAMWYVNTAGLRRLGYSDHPTGRIYRQDREIATLTGGIAADLAALSRQLSSYGVAGVTEATPGLGKEDLDFLDAAAATGTLRQRIHVLSAPTRSTHHNLTFGAVKRILDDDSLDLDDIVQWIGDTHRAGRPVAVHCVTTVQLLVTLTAMRSVGALVGDRIEHAAMAPDDLLSEMASLGVTVVTQPNFIAERGDEYLAEVPIDEQPSLWRLATLTNAGIAVAGSTDAPFGSPDPWASMRAARDRTTRTGRQIGALETISARAALDLFLGTPHSPGTPQQIRSGMVADLCLLSAPPADVLEHLSADLVSATLIGGVAVTSAP